jgi:hypothetical protein
VLQERKTITSAQAEKLEDVHVDGAQDTVDHPTNPIVDQVPNATGWELVHNPTSNICTRQAVSLAADLPVTAEHDDIPAGEEPGASFASPTANFASSATNYTRIR